MVAVRRYSNTPFTSFGRQSIHFIWMWALSLGVHYFSTISIRQAALVPWLLPISRTEVLLPSKVGEEGLETYHHLSEFLWDGLLEEHYLSDPISLSFPLPTPPPQLEEGTQTEGGPDCHPASIQTEEESGYHPSLKLLQDNNQARAQLEYELVQEAQELAERYKCK